MYKNKYKYVIIVSIIYRDIQRLQFRRGVFLEAHLTNYKKNSKITFGLFTTLIATVLISACGKGLDSNLVICNRDDYSLYSKLVEEILPTFAVRQSENNIYHYLDNGAIVEAFDTQAVGAIETGLAKHWYPQYLATVVIAVDRDQTRAQLNSWSDLFSTQEEVAFFDTPGNVQMQLAAMSYGLEGQDYTLTKAIQLLASLNDDKLLKINSFESPIIICYDYQAVNLIEHGRNLEIIIPKEGTFTYIKGLLSQESLIFQGKVEDLLDEKKLLSIEGKNDYSIYPEAGAYAPAIRVSNYKHFAKVTENVSCLIQRDVFKSKRYMSIDNREHLYSALFYIILVTIWTASVLRRSMQKGIRYAAFFTGIILNGWTLVRLIKYQVDEIPTFNRYLWYAFYIFQLSLPLVMLWMAWAIDKPEDETFPPKWWRIIAIIVSGLIILVFTNDFHGLVFHLDLSKPDWGVNYSYGFGYYIILFVCMMNLIGMFIILMRKSIRNSRKKAFLFPIFIFAIFGLYTYKYITRDPFVYNTDLTIITGIFTMLMFESCIRSGLIPVNTKYIDLFTRSPLKMQIINTEGEIVLMSASATPLNEDTLDKVLDLSFAPIFQDDKSLLFTTPIPGGYAIWHEDISKIYQLHREIQESTQMLAEANAILAEEEKSKRFINEKNAKKLLMDQLEEEIAESTKLLSKMIENLPYAENNSIETSRIALLLCYIKRRCNLFFREKEINNISTDELIIYLDELSEIAMYSNLKIITVDAIKGSLAIRHATLFYDFFYTMVDLTLKKRCHYIIVNLETEEELVTMRLLPSENIGDYKLESNLIVGIAAAKGNVIIKDLEDTIGISISFPKGGEIDD